MTADTGSIEATPRSLVSLLGAQRAAIVEHLRSVGDATVADLAEHLGVSEVATRRHLTVLQRDGLIDAHRVRQGLGRPPARFALTQAADQLFPQSYDRLASDVIDFLSDAYGSDGLNSFLRWRLEREVRDLREAVTAEDLHARLEQLAAVLSAAGFAASVTPTRDGFELTQDHCAIYDIARSHPEICASEAAAFSQVLGHDVTLSRRATLSGGSSACVCAVSTCSGNASAPKHEARSATPVPARPQPGDVS